MPNVNSQEGGDRTPPFIQKPATPWGLWATLGLSFLIGAVFVFVQILVLVALVILWTATGQKLAPEEIETNGLLLALATLAGTPAALGAIWFFCTRRQGMSISEYLALWPVPKTTYVKCGLALVILIAVGDGMTKLLDKPVVPEFMVKAYETAGFLPILWLAVIVAAPLGEEVFFRGFLFRGIEHSRLGGTGAILISATGWAVIHLQYELFVILQLWVFGLVLGVVRLKTQSLYPAIFMHSLSNFIASVQVAIL